MKPISTYNKLPKYKLFFGAMIFAFLWVIIGDLVNMHIRVITGDDLYGHHQPYAKSNKTDKKSFKVKDKKAGNDSKELDINFLSDEVSDLFDYRKATDFLYWFVPKLIASASHNSSQGRAPPQS